ncbi:MAG: FeoB small GTPase domain-containing protein [Candidatus Bathyarchaeia archaeon]
MNKKKLLIALAGNANVGKSVIFNYLTGLHQHIGKKINHSNVAIDTGLFLCSPKVFEYANQAMKKGASELADCVRIAGQSGDAQVIDVSGHVWADVDTK